MATATIPTEATGERQMTLAEAILMKPMNKLRKMRALRLRDLLNRGRTMQWVVQIEGCGKATVQHLLDDLRTDDRRLEALCGSTSEGCGPGDAAAKVVALTIDQEEEVFDLVEKCPSFSPFRLAGRLSFEIGPDDLRVWMAGVGYAWMHRVNRWVDVGNASKQSQSDSDTPVTGDVGAADADVAAFSVWECNHADPSSDRLIASKLERLDARAMKQRLERESRTVDQFYVARGV